MWFLIERLDVVDDLEVVPPIDAAEVREVHEVRVGRRRSASHRLDEPLAA